MPKDTTTTISTGTVITSRKGKYQGTVSKVTLRGFVITRPSGKTVTITNRKIVDTFKRLVDGEILAYQRNPGDGGISYTVIIERGVIAALGANVIETPTGYKLA